eukprot:gnl/MRDRNA2_/MRDRNA2_68944_c0_seq2.p1 gnl/MRDRNA2_/MRDRNA2_68944_c0~~gnl/MRDRNA2_/MRDRNA2_68944_c0_seq2.p1  ORF type:complete len:317 (+),score=45.01 gnl/MRDRNA2_/MRDRNA2_68944_c0_seq2:67-1017(+)
MQSTARWKLTVAACSIASVATSTCILLWRWRTPRRSKNGVELEVCCDSVSGAVEAAKAGAARVELCATASLKDGGLTPSAGAIAAAIDGVRAAGNGNTTLHVLIRPRAGGFFYSPEEVGEMTIDVDYAVTAGADGVVIGCLLQSGCIDHDSTSKLVRTARRAAYRRLRPVEVTFHRACDAIPGPSDDASQRLLAQELHALGIDRILTSGRASTAEEGRHAIAALNAIASPLGITTCCASGVGMSNASLLVGETGVRQLHAGSSVSGKSCDRQQLVATAGGEPSGLFAAPPGSDVMVSQVKVASFREMLSNLSTSTA